MPIEIRELIIKTTIEGDKNQNNASNGEVNNATITRLKKQLLEACKKYINEKVNEEKER